MKNILYLGSLLALLATGWSCDKGESNEKTVKIASYYGFASSGNGLFKALNVCTDGKWEVWPMVEGLDYREGYEYEVEVRIEKRADLDGYLDVAFPYSVKCLKVVGKTQRESADCPLPAYEEGLFNYLAPGYAFEGQARIASYRARTVGGEYCLLFQCGDCWYIINEAQVTGIDYEEGYEYVVEVDSHLVSVDDCIPVCECVCKSILKKEAKETADCPIGR